MLHMPFPRLLRRLPEVNALPLCLALCLTLCLPLCLTPAAQAADDAEFPPSIGQSGQGASSGSSKDGGGWDEQGGGMPVSPDSPDAPGWGGRPSSMQTSDTTTEPQDSEAAAPQGEQSQDSSHAGAGTPADASANGASNDASAAPVAPAGEAPPAATGSGQPPEMERIPGLATPSPYDDSSLMFDKPFALSRLRTFTPQRGALTVVKKQQDQISDITVDVDICDTLAGSKAGDLEAFKKHLLDKARQKAAYLLFTRMYAGQSQVGVQDQLPPDYQQALAAKVQFTGEPHYHNGDTFGELCVKTAATLPAGHVDTAAPLIATLQNFCYREEDATEAQVENVARDAALDRIVQNIVPGVQLPDQTRAQFLRDADITGQLGGQNNDVYCLNMQLEVAPLELMPHLPDSKAKAAAPQGPETLASTSQASWSLNLTSYSEGQPAPDFGKNLQVYNDPNGKSLGPVSREGALAVIPVTSSNDFALRVLVARTLSYDFLYSETIEFLRFHFANKKWEQVAFVMSMDDKNSPVAYYQSRLQASETFPWDMAVNFNDCYLIKQNGQIRFFFNGRFVLAYPTEGTSLTEVRVPLQWDDRLYNVLVKNLDQGAK